MGRKREIPKKIKIPSDHPQAELGLSHIWCERRSKTHSGEMTSDLEH